MCQKISIESRRGAKRDTVRRLRLLALGLSTALPLVAFVPAPAGATPTPEDPAPAPAENCVIDVTSGSATPSERCFPTFTEAIRFATDGAITDAPTTAAEGVDDPDLNELLGSSEKSADTKEPIAALVVIGIEYGDAYYRGASYTFRRTRNCTGTTTDVDYSFELPRRWWDRISSFKNYANCHTNHYALSGFRGSETGYLNDRSVMPTIDRLRRYHNFNDDTRSIRWS